MVCDCHTPTGLYGWSGEGALRLIVRGFYFNAVPRLYTACMCTANWRGRIGGRLLLGGVLLRSFDTRLTGAGGDH